MGFNFGDRVRIVDSDALATYLGFKKQDTGSILISYDNKRKGWSLEGNSGVCRMHNGTLGNKLTSLGFTKGLWWINERCLTGVSE